MLLLPDSAFCLVLFGSLATYCEFLRPGLVLPGIAGAAAVVTGAYSLFSSSPTTLGGVLIGSAAILFLLDAFFDSYFIAAIAATTALTFGFMRLLYPPGIRPALAIPCCTAFGVITAFLNWAARRARRNKWADLSAGQ